MRIRVATVLFTALLTAGMALAGCNPDTTTSGGRPTAAAAATTSPSTSAAAVTVPALTGLGLQTAQDTAQAHGFYNLTSHDASGGDRMQILDRNWKVCDQTPDAGTATSKDVKIDLGAVKLDETCPGDTAPTTAPVAAPSATPPTHPATRKPAVHHSAASHSSTSGGSGSSGSSGSSATSGSSGSTSHHTEAPVAPGGGATAQCNDGTLSYSQHHQGTCSHHGGVAVWYK